MTSFRSYTDQELEIPAGAPLYVLPGFTWHLFKFGYSNCDLLTFEDYTSKMKAQEDPPAKPDEPMPEETYGLSQEDIIKYPWMLKALKNGQLRRARGRGPFLLPRQSRQLLLFPRRIRWRGMWVRLPRLRPRYGGARRKLGLNMVRLSVSSLLYPMVHRQSGPRQASHR